MCRQFLLLIAIVSILPLTACTRLKVESTPPGATVLWSPDGLQDWRPWPPRVWSSQSTGKSQTPLSEYGRYGDSVWITVQKDGFYRPLPQLAQLYPARNEKLSFELVETPEALRERMMAQGLVYFGGEWVEPKSVGLVNYEGEWLPAAEAFAREQSAKGLVEYNGEWMTPQQRGEKFAADQRAKGLVLFKDRWVSTEVRDKEEALDSTVRDLAGQDTILLSPPKVIGRIDAETAQVQLLNATGHPVRFLVSGPMSREYLLSPYDSYGMTGTGRITLPAGRYIVAAIPMPLTSTALQMPDEAPESELKPALSEQPLAGGFQYLFSYDGGRDLNIGDLESYEFQEPEMPYDLPEIEIPEIELPERPNNNRGPRGGGGGRPPGR
ncbi:hypothetical protein KQI84_00520 [bacterium]|nr:hypothetical protein [bacterium]